MSVDHLRQDLPAQWQDWITSQLVAGVPETELINGLTDKGFASDYATCAVSVIRSMTHRVQQSNPNLLEAYVADPIRIDSRKAKVRAADRDIEVVFVLSNPNLAVLRNVLSVEECQKLIQLSKGKLTRSTVVASNTGHVEASKVRTSEGTHFEWGENAIIQRFEARISALFGQPINYAEPTQILHYHQGGEYLPHQDFFDPADPGSAQHLQVGGQRVATLVTYLNDVPEGGETEFPELELSVRPSAGTSVYFEYCNRQSRLDRRCLHAGVPVLKGDKWIATKWFRQTAYVAG
jgi:prolyl 4-hydroxylase